MYLLLNLLIIIAIELPVFLYFFRNEKLTALHFTVVMNAVTFSIGNMMVIKLGFPYYPVQTGVFILEILMVTFFWNVGIKRAFVISLIANGLSFLFFEVANHFNLLG